MLCFCFSLWLVGVIRGCGRECAEFVFVVTSVGFVCDLGVVVAGYSSLFRRAVACAGVREMVSGSVCVVDHGQSGRGLLKSCVR